MMINVYSNPAKPARHNFGKSRITMVDRDLPILAAFAEYTNTTGATLPDGTVIGLFEIQPGTILTADCVVNAGVLAAGRTISVGWTAYTEPDGTAVAADPAGLLAATDASAGLTRQALAITKPMLFKARTFLIATVAGGTVVQNQPISLDLRYGRVSGRT